MNKTIKFFLFATLLLAVPFQLISCGDSKSSPEIPSAPTDEIVVSIPPTIDVVKGEDCTLSVTKGTIQSSDIVLLESSTGILTQCPVTNIGATSFSFNVPSNFQSGTYKVYLRRGDRRISLGSMVINIVSKQIELQQGTTVYGTVECEDIPVAGVVVSDGVEVTVTNAEGIYQLPSKKEAGYVFISVPGGYEPESEGVFPRVYVSLKADDSVVESASFKLKKVNQDTYKVLFLGDMHLAARTNDLNQFKKVTEDINAYRLANGSLPVYGITLGDMTWDLYWYDNKFNLSNYVNEINKDIDNMIIYQTIGNHDNDFKTYTNVAAKMPFNTTIAPIYYSFNIGKVHYVVLDNIDCSEYDGTTSRNYFRNLFVPQLEWLSKDLQYVDKSTPVVVVMHAPMYGSRGLDEFSLNLRNSDELANVLTGYTVHFVTGHTHKNYNVLPSMNVTEGQNFYEHNVGAVCSDWWWSGYLTPGCLVSTDGTPSGYSAWTFSGTTPQYVYKSVGMDETHQFRCYDLNNVSFSMSDVPNLKNTTVQNAWRKYCDEFDGVQRNEILLNIWNYNPNWTINVTTADGKVLNVEAVDTYDPLHVEAMSKKRFNNDVSSIPNFVTEIQYHFFKATAPDATTDLVISVSDEFGHTWTETMERPKPFSTEVYAIEY